MSSSLEPSIVRICSTDGIVVGAGFFVGERHVLTCAHVVAGALGLADDTPEKPQAPVSLDVPRVAPRMLLTARVLTLVVRRCRNQECDLYHLPYRAEEEGAWALPHGEFGLDIITVVGQLRYGEHRSIPEIHQRLVQRGVSIAQRTVTDLLERYEELVALHLADEERIKARLKGASPGAAGH